MPRKPTEDSEESDISFENDDENSQTSEKEESEEEEDSQNSSENESEDYDAPEQEILEESENEDEADVEYKNPLEYVDLNPDMEESHVQDGKSTLVPASQRQTKNTMTRYEMVRILGVRSQQFAQGAPPLIDGVQGLTPSRMAYLELLARKTPFIIRRPLPHKKYELWRVDELELHHVVEDPFFVPENFDREAFLKSIS